MLVVTMLIYARMRRSLNAPDDSTSSKEPTIPQGTGTRGIHPDAQQEIQIQSDYSTEAPSYTVISMVSSQPQDASQTYSSDSGSRYT